MALSVNNKIKELLKNPEAKEIMKKNGINVNDPQLKMAMGMTLKAVCTFPGRELDPKILEGLNRDFEAANLE